jgi:hypothetical protein
MPIIRWTRAFGRRELGPYVWDTDNLYRCYVRPEDYLEVITNPDFVVVERDNFYLLDGLEKEAADELEWAGIVTFAELVEAPAAAIAARCGLDADQIRAWQDQVRAIESNAAA